MGLALLPILIALFCVVARPLSGAPRGARVRHAALTVLSLYATVGALQDLSLLEHCEDSCPLSCPDDTSDKQCAPNCHTCPCGTPFARLPAASGTSQLREADTPPVGLEPLPEIPTPPLSDIFRPPVC